MQVDVVLEFAVVGLAEAFDDGEVDGLEEAGRDDELGGRFRFLEGSELVVTPVNDCFGHVVGGPENIIIVGRNRRSMGGCWWEVSGGKILLIW